jgi:hypothetical protein
MPNRRGNRKHRYDWPGFGRAITLVREELGWPRTTLAKAIGVNSGTLKHSEDGTRGLSEERRAALIDALVPVTGDAATTSRRQVLLRLAGLAGARDGVGGTGRTPSARDADRPGDGDGPGDGWERWLHVGHARARLDPEQAREAYAIAARRAEAIGATGAQALALAHQAEMLCDVNRPEAAEVVARRGMTVLGIPANLRPARHPIASGEAADHFTAGLAEYLTDGQSPTAYAQLAKGLARSKLDRMAYAEAEPALQALLGIAASPLLNDPRFLADGYQHLALLDVERATWSTPIGDPEWRRVIDVGAMERALVRLERARQIRPPDDAVLLGYDWRATWKVLHLLGRGGSEAAMRAAHEARDRLQETTGLVLLRLDEGRRERVAGDAGVAEAAFRETVEQALAIRSPSLLAIACALLAELSARQPNGARAASAYAAAAIISWPTTTYRRDYDRVRRWFVELCRAPSRDATRVIDALVEGKSYPIVIASQMPGYTAERARARLRDALRTPPTPQRR